MLLSRCRASGLEAKIGRRGVRVDVARINIGEIVPSLLRRSVEPESRTSLNSTNVVIVLGRARPTSSDCYIP